jgi:DNA/RNA-binding domain of Phe-tRNA-synthetase-like protein
MEFKIEQSIAEKYPNLRIGILVAKGINNLGTNPKIKELKKTKTEEFVKNFTADSLKENPFIKAWQETYRSFGVNPKKKKPTAESLLMRLLKGSSLPTISTVVDLYLTIETEYLLPIGGYDLDTISEYVVLKQSEGDESFYPIGSEKEEKTQNGEVVYADAEKILTRRWNYKDCDKSKIETSSKSIILMSEATDKSISTEHLTASFDKLKSYIAEHCGGQVSTYLVDINTLSFQIE